MTAPAPLPLVAPSDWFMPAEGEYEAPVRPLAVVAPPVPAPYLAAVPEMPRHLRKALGKPQSPLHLEAVLLYERIKQEIFFRRHDFEDREGLVIVPEPPKKPSQLK